MRVGSPRQNPLTFDMSMISRCSSDMCPRRGFIMIPASGKKIRKIRNMLNLVVTAKTSIIVGMNETKTTQH